MLNLKHSVDMRGLKPEALLIVMVACEAFAPYDCVITSVTDSKHTSASLHGLGYAVDFRTRHLVAGRAEAIVAKMQAALGPSYQVVLESDHIHGEFDPRALLAT